MEQKNAVPLFLWFSTHKHPKTSDFSAALQGMKQAESQEQGTASTDTSFMGRRFGASIEK